VRRVAFAAVIVLVALSVTGARAQPVCQETPRAPANPVFAAQQQAFGFHDEEVVICSPGYTDPTHIAARLWVPSSCPGVGGCPGVVIAPQFTSTKEVVLSDMLNAVHRGLYALSYDERGQGTSGGQATFESRDDIVDQAAVLRWFHHEVRPTKTAVQGVSGGGWLALTAAIFNCGSARAAHYDSSIPCDRGERWVDAIAPEEPPAAFSFDEFGTCQASFALSAFIESRAYPGFVPPAATCVAHGTPAEAAAGHVRDVITADLGPYHLVSRLGRIDVPVYLVTSFGDRTVLPNTVVREYELLRARVRNPNDPYKRDVRLLISDEGHGGVEGNFAVVNDVFSWIDRILRDKGPQRGAPVVIAQHWAGDAFRLEREWPIPGTKVAQLYLSRTANDAAGAGKLVPAAPRGSEPADELMNVPMDSGDPGRAALVGAPGVDQLWEDTSPTPIPGLRLDYETAPMSTTIELSGDPVLTLWISSLNGVGNGQIHAALYEVRADGSAIEFSRGRVAVWNVGTRPQKATVLLTTSDYRIPKGSRLLLTIMPSDVIQVTPAVPGGTTLVQHSGGTPSALTFGLAPVDRVPPKGTPPSGAAYTSDPVGAICGAFALPC